MKTAMKTEYDAFAVAGVLWDAIPYDENLCTPTCPTIADALAVVKTLEKQGYRIVKIEENKW